MLVFKFGADLVTFNHAAGLLPLFLFLVLLFFMDSTRGGGGAGHTHRTPRYRGGGALDLVVSLFFSSFFFIQKSRPD